MKTVIKLPITGHFAEARRKYKHAVPNLPAVGLEDQVKPSIKIGPYKPFKSWVVAALHSVRECGQVWGDPVFTDAPSWAEASGCIEPTECRKDDPYRVDVMYRLSEKGSEFMKTHEAPVAWR